MFNHHPNIISPLGVCREKRQIKGHYVDSLCIIFPQLEQLHDPHHEYKISPHLLAKITDIAEWIMLADAVRYAHSLSKTIIDLKPQNCLWSPTNGLTLIDLGSTKTIRTTTGGFAFTVPFACPTNYDRREAKKFDPDDDRRDKMTPVEDVYSLGVSLICFARGLMFPWQRDKVLPLQVRSELIAAIQSPLDTVRPLLTAMVQDDPAQRPTMEQVVDTLKNLAPGGAGASGGGAAGGDDVGSQSGTASTITTTSTQPRSRGPADLHVIRDDQPPGGGGAAGGAAGDGASVGLPNRYERI